MPYAFDDPASACDVLVVGGGLSGGLVALRLAAERPELRVIVLEAGTSLGAGHTWSCFETDLSPASRRWVGPLARHRWPAYTVRFPALARRLTTPYQSLTDPDLHGAVACALGAGVVLNTAVAALSDDHVLCADGRRIDAAAVIDARGPTDDHKLVLGYQKFVGLELETPTPHGVREPMIMDAGVAQLDGYRFLYLLPFSPTRLLVEDTRYADAAPLDEAAVTRDALVYAAERGWSGAQIVRRERGVLPVALAGDITAFWRDAERAGPAARVGLRAALFHPTTGYSLPDAVRTAELIAALPVLTTASVGAAVKAASIAAWEARSFYRRLDRMLFRAAAPVDRYKVLQRFHRLPRPLIERFYAARSTRADRLRILCGRPPVPLGAALRSFSEQRLLAEVA